MIFNYLANQCLQLATAKAKTITGSGKCYLGLSTTEPAADGTNITEPTNASYERKQVSIYDAIEYTDMWGSISGGIVSNAQEITTRECTEDDGWPTCYYFVLFDAKTGGNPLAADKIRDPDGEVDENGLYPESSLTVAKGKVAVFRAGALQLKLQ